MGNCSEQTVTHALGKVTDAITRAINGCHSIGKAAIYVGMLYNVSEIRVAGVVYWIDSI